MREFAGKVCVVTGAGSGIGQATAWALARRGGLLCLLDRDEPGLQRTAETIRRASGIAHTYTVDVSDRDGLYELAERITTEHGGCSLLMNNAGVTTAPAQLDELSQDHLDWLLGINLRAVLDGTRAFLPQLRRQAEAHVINVSSLAGLVGITGYSHYCAAKAGVRGFGEALRMDLWGTSVGVTNVYPGGVSTNIIANARGYDETDRDAALAQVAKSPLVSAEHAAGRIVRAVERRRGRVLIGRDAQALDLLARLAPEAHIRLLHPVMKRYTARTKVTGGSR
jgi:NADP-dependent 3-hydroxy acid dehydrogenase YdfG